jgi:hypothetical protein
MSFNETVFSEIKTDKLLIGADPEVFFNDPKKNLYVPAIGLVGGSKAVPLQINEYTWVQEDNVLCEYNIKPAKNLKEFTEYILGGLAICKDIANSQNLDISVRPSALLKEDILNKCADPERAFTFGCEPDFNAYTGRPNPKPKPNVQEDEDGTWHLRTAGGHVHVGFYDNNKEYGYNVTHRNLIKWMDIVLGLWSITKDTDINRRNLYGDAGAFRPKPYGVEYRTLSNFWISDEDFIYKVYQKTLQAYKLAVYFEQNNVAHANEILKSTERAIQEAIKTSNKLYYSSIKTTFKEELNVNIA